jgi:hypothetical protein
MTDVHVVYALAREAGGDLLALLLDVEDEGEKALDVGWGYIVSIGPLYERLPFEI